MRIPISFCSIILIVSTANVSALAEILKLNLMDRVTLEDRLKAGLVPVRERQQVMLKLFEESGCQATLQPIDKHFSNVICRLQGETDATIVVGAHSDFANEGTGIVDDWSGASMLPSLYQALRSEHRKHSYEFVAFTGEERGLLGSDEYLRHLSREQKAGTEAFVNLECLGLTPPKVWVNRSTPMLVKRLAEVAGSINIQLKGVNVDKVGDDDTHPFLNRKIPVITIHSITQETWGILHTARDNKDAIHADDYYDAYKLAAFYLLYLDEKSAAR